MLDVAVKYEEPIGVAVGISEVELFALAEFDAKVLVLIVHQEGFEVAQRSHKPIVFVGGLVANAVGGRNQPALARAHSMLVNDGDCRVEADLAKAKREIARARLDGTLKMKHPFYHRDDDNTVEATVVGLLDFEPAGARVRSLQLATVRASYGRTWFGVVVNSVTDRVADPKP